MELTWRAIPIPTAPCRTCCGSPCRVGWCSAPRALGRGPQPVLPPDPGHRAARGARGRRAGGAVGVYPSGRRNRRRRPAGPRAAVPDRLHQGPGPGDGVLAVARTRKQARPDVRLPTARAARVPDLEIVVDAHDPPRTSLRASRLRSLGGLACVTTPSPRRRGGGVCRAEVARRPRVQPGGRSADGRPRHGGARSRPQGH